MICSGRRWLRMLPQGRPFSAATTSRDRAAGRRRSTRPALSSKTHAPDFLLVGSGHRLMTSARTARLVCRSFSCSAIALVVGRVSRSAWSCASTRRASFCFTQTIDERRCGRRRDAQAVGELPAAHDPGLDQQHDGFQLRHRQPERQPRVIAGGDRTVRSMRTSCASVRRRTTKHLYSQKN